MGPGGLGIYKVKVISYLFAPPLEKICSLAPDYLHYKLGLSQSLGLLARKLAMHLNVPHE